MPPLTQIRALLHSRSILTMIESLLIASLTRRHPENLPYSSLTAGRIRLLDTNGVPQAQELEQLDMSSAGRSSFVS